MLYNLFFSLSRDEFSEIASAITQLFTTESFGTYFLPSVRNTQTQAKSYSAYIKFKFNLREVGLIDTRKKNQSQPDKLNKLHIPSVYCEN